MLGVTVETLRRWETEGRLRMERSEGGQRLVDIDEVTRLLDERRRAATDRPIVAQSARNRFPGIVTRIEKDRVAAVVEVLAGPHRIVSLMTAEAVDELGLKVGDEAVCVVKATNVIVEIPSAEGVAGVRSARASSASLLAGPRRLLERRRLAIAERRTSAAPAATAPASVRRIRRRPRRSSSRSTARRRSRARSRRRRPPTRRPIPGVTLTISTDSSAALETQIEQGAPADVFLSADATNPQKLVDEGLADGAAGHLRRQQAHHHRADRTTRPGSRRRPTSPGPASRSSPPATRSRSRSTRPSSSTNLAEAARLPGRLRRGLRRQHRVEGGQRQGGRRQDRARRGRRRDRLRHRREGLDQGRDDRRSRLRPTCRRPTTASSSRPRRTATRRTAFLDWFAGPDGQAILGGFGFLPPVVIEEPPGVPGTARPRPVAPPGRSAPGRWGERSLIALAGLFALFLGAAGPRPRRAGDPRRVARGSRSPRPVVLDALWLSLVTTAISLVVTVVARAAARVRARPAAVPRQGARRGDRRPADRPAAVGRRASRCCSSSVGAACSAAPFELLGISVPFTTVAVILAQTFVVGAVLRPLGADRHRRRRSRPRGRGAGRRRLGAAAVPLRHGPARRAPPSPPGWS